MNQHTSKNEGNNAEIQSAKKMAEQASETLKQSSMDWVEYIKNHPIQAMVYGVIIFYAFKGMTSK